MSHGALLLVRDELLIASQRWPELDECLRSRGLEESKTFIDVDSVYFDFPTRARRVPTKTEYRRRKNLFLVAKYAILLSWFLMLLFMPYTMREEPPDAFTLSLAAASRYEIL